MQSVDVAQFLDLIDDLLLYNPVSERATVEACIYREGYERALKISKKLLSGHLELVVFSGNIFGEYFLFGTEDPAAKFNISPPSESSDSIRGKLRPIIMLDAQSKNKQASTSLDLLRPERSLQ
jgi:hypothetical protein